MWWTELDEALDEWAYRELPIPWKGLLRMLKYVAWKRARIRPCDL